MNIRQSVWVGLLVLLGATSLSGCSKKNPPERRAGEANAGGALQKPEEAQKIKIQEGFGKTIDPYEKKKGRIGVP